MFSLTYLKDRIIGSIIMFGVILWFLYEKIFTQIDDIFYAIYVNFSHRFL